MQPPKVNEKLVKLFAEYARNLPTKIAKIEERWLELKEKNNQKALEDFHRDIHSLCGSASTYGYIAVGAAARQLEIYLKSLMKVNILSPVQIIEISILLERVKTSIVEEVPKPSISESKIAENNVNTNNILIFDNDENAVRDLCAQIDVSIYSLIVIQDLSEIERIIQLKKPIAFIINISSVATKDIQYLYDIQKITSVLFICIDEQCDILTRLTAARMGAQFFLQKPVESFTINKILDQLKNVPKTDPYRILIIDDSQSLSEYFSLILQNAGMTTAYINNPLLLIEKIDDFQPDLLLMDIYMPECSGLELAAVLRQEPRYAHIPITFLSTEDNRSKQLSALNMGGDDFLTKPIAPQHLIDAVKLRAKRACIVSSFMMKDSLTGLLNHTSILQRLDNELARAQRQSEPLSFVMLDIDHFKNVNDVYGHPVGDRIIKSLANLLLTSLRKTDILGRYGGEEFSIIFPNTTLQESIKICNQICEKFSQICYEANGAKFFVTLSAGISNYPTLKNAKTLIDCADQALYNAKNNGRNRVYSFSIKEEADISV